MKDKPLILMIENTKKDMSNAFAQIVSKSGLPAFLIEGIILDILSDVRNRKNIELSEVLAEEAQQSAAETKAKKE